MTEGGFDSNGDLEPIDSSQLRWAQPDADPIADIKETLEIAYEAGIAPIEFEDLDIDEDGLSKYDRLDASFLQDPHRWTQQYVENTTEKMRAKVIAHEAQQNGRTN